MQLPELTQAARRGIVSVRRSTSGWSVSGAVDDMLLTSELYMLNGVRDDGGGWTIPSGAFDAELDDIAMISAAAAKAVANRSTRSAKDGTKLYGKKLAALQKSLTRTVRGAYSASLPEFQRELKQLDKVIAGSQLAPEDALRVAHRRGELENMIDALSAGMAAAGASAEAAISARLPEAAATGWNIAAWQMDNMVGMRISRFLGHDYAALAAHSKYDLIAWHSVANKAAAKKRLTATITRGLLMGHNPHKMARELQGDFSQWQRRAITIARTESGRIMSEANQESMAAANDAGIKMANRWDATLDGNTRKSHRRMDGEVRAIGEKFSNGQTRPGRGAPEDTINCRCCLTPVLEGFTPDAPMRRANASGRDMPYLTYSQWEKAGG